MGGDRREWKGTESVLVCQVPYLVSRYKVVGGGVLPPAGTWYCSAAAALPALPCSRCRYATDEEDTIAVFARRFPDPE